MHFLLKGKKSLSITREVLYMYFLDLFGQDFFQIREGGVLYYVHISGLPMLSSITDYWLSQISDAVTCRMEVQLETHVFTFRRDW